MEDEQRWWCAGDTRMQYLQIEAGCGVCTLVGGTECGAALAGVVQMLAERTECLGLLMLA